MSNTCKNCIHWGVDERGYKHNALLKVPGSKFVHKPCVKQTLVICYYTHQKFICDKHEANDSGTEGIIKD